MTVELVVVHLNANKINKKEVSIYLLTSFIETMISFLIVTTSSLVSLKMYL